MNIQQFINSKYIDSLSESQKQYLIEHKKFKDRSVIEKRLADKFEDVKFTGRGSDVNITIGEYKWITTMEFLKEIRERCCYKIHYKRSNDDGSTDYEVVDTLTPFDSFKVNDNYYPQDMDFLRARQSLNLYEIKEEKGMDDETRRYKEYMKLYYIYVTTPIKKRKNKEARFMNLYFVIVDGSFDPRNLTVIFAADADGDGVACNREGLLDLDCGNGEWVSCSNDSDENIVTEIELPYVMKAIDNVTAHKVDRYDFSFMPERYCGT